MKKLSIILFLSFISLIICQEFAMFGPEFGTSPMTTTENLEKFLMFLGADDPKPDPKPDDPKPDEPKEKPSTFENLFNSFMKVTNSWTKIIDTFKTTRSSTVKETLLGKGFEAFSSSAQVQVTKGVREEFLDKYLNNLATRVKVPEERKTDLILVLEESKWADSSVWSAYNNVFSVDNGGNTKFVSILCARNETKGTYDFVFSDVKAEFKLAPDVMIINKKLSVLGGIWADEKDIQQRVPKNITQEDIQTVISFFNVIAFKTLADQFGIKLDFPKI